MNSIDQKSFKQNPIEMTKLWDESIDNQLGMIQKGFCSICWNDGPVVIQRGVFRFGVSAGMCFEEIEEMINQSKFSSLILTYPFENAENVHTASMGINFLKQLKDRTEPCTTNPLEPDLPLSQEYKEKLENILNRCQKEIEKAEQEEQKLYLCKKCNKCTKEVVSEEKDKLKDLNTLREKHLYGLCFGCNSLASMKPGQGCSLFTCSNCISGTTTCVVCEGTGKVHDLVSCTLNKLEFPKNPLPPLKECDC